MRVTPIGSYDTPQLPTHSVLDEHPELLKLVPRRWQRNPVVLSALAGLCVLASTDRAAAGETAPHARIAPIFQHGDGRGSFGCKAINPPVYFTEDEARQVIAEEAKRAGIVFGQKSLTLAEVRLPTVGWDGKKVTREAVPLELDGRDARVNVAYEFVSEKDAYAWSSLPAATAYSLSTLDRAKDLRKLMAAAKPAGAYAVFYDPLEAVQLPRKPDGSIDCSSIRGVDRAGLQQRAREHLRAQVRDFIKWLKAQGVI